MTYPKRLIEVDLPIARISAHARREKSIRHGHISTLHIWWARRPLAACRAVICAALWPDPVDPLCPPAFRTAAITSLLAFAKRVNPDRLTVESRQLQETLSEESRGRWEALASGTLTLDAAVEADMFILRMALLDFIADFANWDNSTVPAYLETSRALTQAAHEALGGVPGTRPLVVDPFAGGGSIPLEALRVGADAFASDLNPIPVLLNKVVLEYIPKYGKRLAEEVRKWGAWIEKKATESLRDCYPVGPHNTTPIAYAWARTVVSEAPGGESLPVELPLLTTMWLAKTSSNDRALRWVRDVKGCIETEDVEVSYADGSKQTVRRPKIEIFRPLSTSDVEAGTVARGSVTCPISGYTTKASRVKEQLRKRAGGASDARLLAIRETSAESGLRTYREPQKSDFDALSLSLAMLSSLQKTWDGPLPLLPDEPTPMGGGKGAGRAFSQRGYGMNSFSDMFTPRQQLSLATLCRFVKEVPNEFVCSDTALAEAVQACLGIALARLADFSSSLCTIKAAGNRGVNHMFGRQAIPIVWDFAESNIINPNGASWQNMIEYLVKTLETMHMESDVGQAAQADATASPLSDDMVDAVITDPPYYDAIPYSDLSDYFYVWLKRSLCNASEFLSLLTPKEGECIVDEVKGKDANFFVGKMQAAMAESRRVLSPRGIGVVVFAHKSTTGWEAMLQAVIDAGWIITASWPIDTEMGSRLRAQGSAALASSVHLVCRPREDADGAVTESIGEWRDVLGELPKRIHEWMPRLTAEGVVGADAIFACLGPALEIFSRYSRVEKSNGEAATLREYLEFVWAAVSSEALALIFKDADASGLEPDARLTAMWLWTLGGGSTNGNAKSPHPGPLPRGEGEGEEDADDDDEPEASASGAKAKLTGFTLEYDAARKIAQGLGVHLEQCQTLVEVKGDKARLLPVSERTAYLFGKGTQAETVGTGRKKKTKVQKTFFAELDDAEAAESGWSNLKGPPPGSTALDRVHQAMILFAANRGELLKRFLVEDGVGKDARFWKLADNLNKLYPPGTEERRWVEGVLARKKGLGL